MGIMNADDKGPVNPNSQKPAINCPSNSATCADIASHLQEELGEYSGHDEPAITFYSHRPGAGNNLTTVLTIPTDPRHRPSRMVRVAPSIFSSIQRSGSAWCFAIPSLLPISHTYAYRIPMPIFSTTLTLMLWISSGIIRGSAFLELQFYPREA